MTSFHVDVDACWMTAKKLEARCCSSVATLTLCRGSMWCVLIGKDTVNEQAMSADLPSFKKVDWKAPSTANRSLRDR